MANKEYEEILKRGARIWNQWREQHPAAELDFRGCHWEKWHLENCDLSNADLRAAKLHGAWLHRANLNRASLSDCGLQGADLTAVSLTRGNLYCADFRDATLRDADLRGSRLYETILVGADLAGANLSFAEIKGVVFGRTDLTATKGLDSVRHLGPSIVDIGSVMYGANEPPNAFLRGIGVPLQFIRWLRSRQPSSSPSCFLSYSTKDTKFVKLLLRDLESEGFDCWFAPGEMKTADKILTRIVEAIRNHDHLIVVMSQNSLKSEWVAKEVAVAMEREHRLKKESRLKNRILFPIDLDGRVMRTREPWAIWLRSACHIGDFRDWENKTSYKNAFGDLIQALRNTK